MQNELLASLRDLRDDELVARLKQVAAREREDVVQVVAHLAELDTRDVHFRAGYASLFAYCRDALALSEAEAYNRIEVARAARRFPVILDMLVQGALNLTTVRLLSPHLTADNLREVLESARGKRKAEVEEIVARLAPRPDAAASVRKLPDLEPAASPLGPIPGSAIPEAPPGAGPVAAPVAALAPPSRPATKPLAPGRYRLTVTISYETLQKLTLAKDMLRHAVPSGDDAAILDRALTALLLEVAKRKFAATDHPRPRAVSPAVGASRVGDALTADPPTASSRAADSRADVSGLGPSGSRHIPAEVKRAVWLRDLGRCAFVGTGRRCTEHGFLEFHHRRPYAIGGEATVTNIELRCRRHNAYEARVFFARDGTPATGNPGPSHRGPTRPQLVPERVGAARGATRSAGPAGDRFG